MILASIIGQKTTMFLCNHTHEVCPYQASHNISWRKSSIITYYFSFSISYISVSYIDFFLNILCYFYNIFYNYLCKIEKKGNSLKYKKAKTAIVSKS